MAFEAMPVMFGDYQYHHASDLNIRQVNALALKVVHAHAAANPRSVASGDVRREFVNATYHRPQRVCFHTSRSIGHWSRGEGRYVNVWFARGAEGLRA